MTTKDKGNIALGNCIQYLANNGFTVLIPLNDAQDYDLAFDNADKICTIQCKYTSQKYSSGNYFFKLYVRGHKNKDGVSYEKYPDYDKIDYYFVTTGDNKSYLIPTNEISHNKTYTINKKSEKYLI
jgi:hypothetical protein